MSKCLENPQCGCYIEDGVWVMSKVKRELVEATGVKSDDLRDLLDGVNLLPDDAFDKLSKAARKWANSANDALEAGRSLPEFPDDGKEPTMKVKKKKGNKKGKPSVAAKRRAVVARPVKKGLSTTLAIKYAVLRNPEISVADLIERLKKAGHTPTKYFAATIRAGFKQDMHIIQSELVKKGLLKEKVL